MLPTLLWRCPICKTNDALSHRSPRLRRDLVSCSACQTVWELIRVLGKDYRMRIIEGAKKGFELPLAEWYDVMKEDFHLVPVTEPSPPLEPGEVLHLASKEVEFQALETDRVFWPQPAPTSLEPDNSPPLPPLMKRVGIGRLFLTNRRLVCQINDRTVSVWLKSVRAVELVTDRFMILRHQDGLYMFTFLRESLLKWLTYIAQAMPAIEKEFGFRARLHAY